MTKPPVLILAARSDIARACAHAFAARGHPLQLAARNVASLEADKTDLELRHNVAVTLHEMDALATETHGAFVDNLPELPRIAVSAIGFMGEHEDNIADPEAGTQVIRANFEGPASLFAHLANRFAARGSGTLVGISSVAGARGRASNYVYGAGKAGFTAFLSGLRNRLQADDVHVVTVLPGFVATKMTEGLDLPDRLTAKPEEVARAICRAVEHRQNIIYVLPVWRLVMAIICAIPEQMFKKMSI